MTRKKRERALKEKQRRPSPPPPRGRPRRYQGRGKSRSPLPPPSPSPPLPPSPPAQIALSPLEAMPDPAQAILAALLGQGGEPDTRQRLATLSRTMRGLHEGTITALSVRHSNYRAEALVSLVQRQHRLLMVDLQDPAGIPALAVVIRTQGCLDHVRQLTLELEFGGFEFKGPTTMGHVFALESVMRIPGVLPRLEQLCFLPTPYWQAGMLPVLAGSLAAHACPSLRVLELGNEGFNDEDLEALAAMLEVRALCPACCGLEIVLAQRILSRHHPLALRTRLMRCLLPTVKELGPFCWQAYEECFVSIRPRQLLTCKVKGPGVPPVEVWESMPGLEELVYAPGEPESIPGRLADLEPFISALNRGVAFQHLQYLELSCVELEVDEWVRLLTTLAGAHCASQLTHLVLMRCNLCPITMATFSDLLGKDTLPMLRVLCLLHNTAIGDNGVEVLAKGLLAASRILLTELDLEDVGMDDKGPAALASVVRAGRFDRLGRLFLGCNAAVTDEGVSLLAQAVEERGLPILSKFRADYLQLVTGAGVRALAHALIQNCPRLKLLDLFGSGANEEGLQDAVAEMVRVADCRYRVEFKV